MIKALTTATAVAMLLLPPSSARAVEVGTDEVVLKNGDSIRGTVLVDDATRVVIGIYGTEEPRTFVRDEVASVKKDKYQIALRPARARIPVRVESDAPATLYELPLHGEPQAVCSTPCDTRLLVGGERSYFIGGDAMPDSEAYVPGPDVTRVTLRADTGSETLTDIGIGLGVPGLALGGASFTLATVFFGTSAPNEKIPSEQWAVWGVVSGVALPLMISGLVFIGKGATTFDAVEERTPTAGVPRQARAPRYWMGEF